MIIGIHSRDNDLVVNPISRKQLFTLQSRAEFVATDELAEISLRSIWRRKRYLKEHERQRAARATA